MLICHGCAVISTFFFVFILNWVQNRPFCQIKHRFGIWQPVGIRKWQEYAGKGMNEAAR